MTDMTVYLRPHSSWLGMQPPRSDTLFGAICWGYALFYGFAPLQELLERFHPTSGNASSRPPFLISSMFLYSQKGDDEPQHIFPKPLGDPFFPPELEERRPTFEELHALKRLKKKRTVTQAQLSDILRGKSLDHDFYHQYLEAIRTRQPQTIPAQGVEAFHSPHSSINRLTGSVDGPRFFYSQECALSSSETCQQGLFFCVKCENQELAEQVQAVLCFLADKGIGGKASVGKGHFKEIRITPGLPYHEPSEDEATHYATFSLTFPDARLRAVLEHSWYQLEKRQGKVESMYVTLGPHAHIWKDHVLMLKEGSVFPKHEQPGYGANPIVRKDDGKLGFDVQQYGYAFPARMRVV